MKALDFLFAAFTAVWIAVFVYLLAIGRRASRLEREVEELRRGRS